jgi:hypothetical protein
MLSKKKKKKKKRRRTARVMKSRRMKWAGHLARMGEKKYAFVFLVGKHEGKRQL